MTSQIGHRLLSCWELLFDSGDQEGSLAPCERRHPACRPLTSLSGHRNPAGRLYEERHLEEWVARRPEAIFPDREVVVVAAEKYAHLPQKIDLLAADREFGLHVVEMKIVPVGRAGQAAVDIHAQMRDYTAFLGWYPRSSLESYYRKFAARFHGSARDLGQDCKARFGGLVETSPGRPVLHEVYLAEGYDADAAEYLRSHGAGRTRLVYFRLFSDGPYIEFWEITEATCG